MKFLDAYWLSYIKEKNNYHSFSSDYSCIIAEFQKWDIGLVVYVTVVTQWLTMMGAGFRCSGVQVQKSMLFSSTHLENTGDLSFLQHRNVALRCFIKLGDKENGGLERSYVPVYLMRGAELTVPIPGSEGA